MTDEPLPITHLEIPLAKMVYLLDYRTEGQGGDKSHFWRGVMGFHSAEELKGQLASILSVDQLQRTGHNRYGWRYHAVIFLTGTSGVTWQIRTAWIVLYGESFARFVTAFPD